MTTEPAAAGATVADIMSRRIVAIRSDCDLHVAVQTFLRTALRHLVVVDRERAVLGILTVEQTMTALASSLGPVRLVGDHVPARGTRVSASDSVRVSRARSTTAWRSTCSRSRRTRACSKTESIPKRRWHS